MDADTKKELRQIKEAIETSRLTLAELHKKLEDIVTDEEGAIEELENADSDKNLARAEECEALRSAVDNLDEALTTLEGEVISNLEG
jgi:polyhydroxyalkanoate synthesis regulator phasin